MSSADEIHFNLGLHQGTARLVDFDEAIQLSNWFGIRKDLEFICDACDRLLATDNEDSVLHRALLVAAVIAYARCFKRHGGVREGFDESDLEAIGKDGVLDLHRFYIDLRDKHFAHSVNSFEQGMVGVMDSGDGEVNLVYLGQYVIGFNNNKDIENLKEIVEFLINVVGGKIAPLDSMLLYRVKGLTSDQIRELPVLRNPSPGEVGQAREGAKRRRRS